MEYHFCGLVSSDLLEIKNFINERIAELDKLVNNEDLLFDLRLVVNELVINGALHGNDLRKTKYVSLVIYINDMTIEIKVKDEGNGIDYDLSDYNHNELVPDGRGLVLVGGLVDELHVNKNLVKVVMKMD